MTKASPALTPTMATRTAPSRTTILEIAGAALVVVALAALPGLVVLIFGP